MSESPIPYGKQLIEDDDIAEVVRVLRSDFLTTGPEVEAFEKALAEACGARHAVVVCNGTAALHCAYVAAGISDGHEVITTPLTFSATSNTVLAVGARPRFVDIDAKTWCLDPKAIEAAINDKTRAISPVDFAGMPADLEAILRIAKSRKLMVIEDASHSIGGKLNGIPVGALADLTTFSFHPVKTITSGEGGAILTNDDTLAQRARDFRNHGLVRDAQRLSRNDGPWYYEIQSLGLNYRLTDFQCALGRSQLRKLPRFTARRRQIVAAYAEAFAKDTRLTLQTPTPGAEASWHLFAVQTKDRDTRAKLFAALRKRNILPQVHYVAVTDFPHYRALGYTPETTPIAARAAERLISLPLYPAMTDAEVTRVIGATREALDEIG